MSQIAYCPLWQLCPNSTIRVRRERKHNCGGSGDFKEETVYRAVGGVRGMVKHAQGRQGEGATTEN